MLVVNWMLETHNGFWSACQGIIWTHNLCDNMINAVTSPKMEELTPMLLLLCPSHMEVKGFKTKTCRRKKDIEMTVRGKANRHNLF